MVNPSPVVQWLNAPSAWPGSTSNAPVCTEKTSLTPGSVPNANLISLNKFKLQPLEVENARVQIPKRFCLRLKLLLLKVSHDNEKIKQNSLQPTLSENHKFCPKIQFSEKFKILNLNFSAKKSLFFRIFKCKNCLNNLNFRANNRDFVQ